MHLLEIVGVTPTNMTFAIAFVYMHKKSECNYTWALNCLKLIMDNCLAPCVIVTNREMTLIKADKIVFSEAKCLLCRCHIYTNVLRYLKKVWLKPYNEMYVSVLIDKFLNFDNHTTNRVENQHAK
uniref:MULE transposase domain-containing protein n=1 Tax=Lactuca sativa TaxID=4236 RepID=A0A9R1V1R1_LACSA|nr:hypothetical protein LSAT_V11C700364540 [Lactuca sativa]